MVVVGSRLAALLNGVTQHHTRQAKRRRTAEKPLVMRATRTRMCLLCLSCAVLCSAVDRRRSKRMMRTSAVVVAKVSVAAVGVVGQGPVG